ncbi:MULTISPECIES: hypothetical protein [unclassified Streptomyces]|uniref:hypothetical protein n=1 Tax=unclassified Streptomyces TaxID=2593676 RepID=UPI0035DAA49B
MSDHAQLAAVAGAAAAALVAEMVRDSWSSARAVAVRVFRRGGETEAERQLSRLDEDQAQVNATGAAVLRDRWQRRFLTLLEDYPEAAEDLAALVSRDSDEPAGGVRQSATGNSGPVIQVGRDNFGGLNTGGS